MVTILEVTADILRTFCTLQNGRQEHCKHQCDSRQHGSSLPDIATEIPLVSVLKIGAFSII